MSSERDNQHELQSLHALQSLNAIPHGRYNSLSFLHIFRFTNFETVQLEEILRVLKSCVASCSIRVDEIE
jgi:hypothetical protein